MVCEFDNGYCTISSTKCTKENCSLNRIPSRDELEKHNYNLIKELYIKSCCLEELLNLAISNKNETTDEMLVIFNKYCKES